jgi:hypothetical protein
MRDTWLDIGLSCEILVGVRAVGATGSSIERAQPPRILTVDEHEVAPVDLRTCERCLTG